MEDHLRRMSFEEWCALPKEEIERHKRRIRLPDNPTEEVIVAPDLVMVELVKAAAKIVEIKDFIVKEKVRTVAERFLIDLFNLKVPPLEKVEFKPEMGDQVKLPPVW